MKTFVVNCSVGQTGHGPLLDGSGGGACNQIAEGLARPLGCSWLDGGSCRAYRLMRAGVVTLSTL